MDRDRKLVLERRALFIGSSLAALGCAPAVPAEEPVPITLPEPRQVVEDKGTEAEPVGQAPPRPKATPDLGYDVPAGVTEATRERYEKFFSAMKRGHEILDRVEPTIPRPCQATVPSCRQALRAVADELNELQRILTFLYICPGSSEEAQEFARTEREHREQLGTRLGRVENAIAESMAAGGSSESEWELIRREAMAAKPFPCLSFACRDEW